MTLTAPGRPPARPAAPDPAPARTGAPGGPRPTAVALLAVGAAAVLTVLLAGAVTLRPELGLYAAAAVLGVLGVVVVHRVPHVATAVLVVFLQLQAALKFYVSDSFGPAKDAASLLVVLVVLAPVVLTRAGRARVGDRWLVAALAALVVVYAIDPAGGHSAGWSPALRLVVESFGLFLAGWLSRDPDRSWRWLARALVGCGLVQSVLGLVQQALGTERLVTDLGLAFGAQVRTTSSGQLRSFGTFDDAFNYGAITTIALVVAAFTIRRAWLRWACVALLAAGVVVSVDRTMIALLPVLALLWLVLHGRTALAALLAAAALLGGIAYLTVPSAPAPPQVVVADAPPGSFLLTLNGRTETWSQVVRGPQDVLFGRGVGVLGTGLARSQEEGIASQGRYEDGVAPDVGTNDQLTSLDNSYLAVVADTGFLGLALLLLAGARVWAGLAPGVRARSATALAGAATLLVVGVDGLTRTSLTAFPFGFVGLLVLGTALGAARGSAAGRAAQVRAADDEAVAH